MPGGSVGTQRWGRQSPYFSAPSGSASVPDAPEDHPSILAAGYSRLNEEVTDCASPLRTTGSCTALA